MRRLRWGLWMFLLAAGTLRVIGAGYLPATRALVGDFAAVFPTRALATWLRPDFPTEQVWQGWFYGPMLHVLTLPLFLVPRWSLVPAVWATVNLAALVISFFLVLKLSGHTRRSLFTTGLLAGLWMLYQPLVNCLAQGNIEILELLLVLWALTSLERRRGALSGVLLGIAAMTKFLPIGFLGWLLVRRQWRATLYGATTVAAIAIATAFTLGWAASGSRQDMSWAVDAPIAGPQELSITSMFVHRSALLLGPADDSIPASFTVWASAARAEAASQTGAVVSLLLAVAIGVTIIRRRHQPSTPSELAVLFMTMFMILPWNHDYYYIFALVPFTLLLQDAVARRDRVLLTMTLAGYLLISPPIPFSWIDQSALMKIRFSDLYGFVDAPTIGGVILWVAAVHRMLSETTSGIVSTWFSARRIVMLAAIVLLAVAAFATATVRLRTPAAQAVSETRAIDPPIHVAGNAALALSADGAYLAYVALQQDQPTLCVRRMDSGATTCHAETRGASVPFFSPDSRWIGFVVGAELRKIAVTGEPGMTTIAPSLGAHNAEWEPDGTILLATPANGLLRVTANDGRTEVVLPPATDASALTGPTLLPSGHTVLVSQPPSGGSVGVGTITAWSLSTGRRTRLFAGTAPHFDSHSGRLMYVVGGRLMSVKFDPTRLVWTGPSFPVSGSVLVTASGGPLVQARS